MNGIYSEDLLTATAATFFDVERVEVLRGPQGTLYGSGSLGGTVRYVTRSPELGEFDASVGGLGGDYVA